MNVKEIECPKCHVTVRGEFGPATVGAVAEGRFDKLTDDQMNFLQTFLRSRGVIRDVEAALGISYPTVRARLDSLLVALGFADAAGQPQVPAPPTPPQPEKPSVKDILSKLDSGALDAQSALDALRGQEKAGSQS